jgi:hypothetical protein
MRAAPAQQRSPIPLKGLFGLLALVADACPVFCAGFKSGAEFRLCQGLAAAAEA